MKPIVQTTKPDPEQPLFADVRGLIEQARSHVASTVNSTLTQLNWQVGSRIASEMLTNGRAAYGQEILPTLSQTLSWSHFIEIFPLKQPLERQARLGSPEDKEQA